MTNTLYHIADWSQTYENNRSRTVIDLRWVAIPNRHDGERYSRLITEKNAAVLFAAWVLLVQVASRCQPRGTLLRANGKPHDSVSLSLKTRAPVAWFNSALPYLVEIGWITAEKVAEPKLAPSCQETDTRLTPDRQAGDEGLEGMEGKGKGGEGTRKGRAGALPDGEWLASLKVDPAYTGIDIDREVAKCARWCETKHKPAPSRQRIVNWLNRAEQPVNGASSIPGANRYQMTAITAAEHKTKDHAGWGENEDGK